jgi:Ca2+/H+ antiporter, TMEM165/GDT1 family
MKPYQFNDRRHFGFPKFLMIILFIFAFLVPLSFIIVALWNGILVNVVHVATINFWQALGLFALSRILFGGFPGKPGWAGRGRHRDWHGMREKWMNMTPEERKNFRQDWRNCSDRGAEPASPAPAPAE